MNRKVSLTLVALVIAVVFAVPALAQDKIAYRSGLYCMYPMPSSDQEFVTFDKLMSENPYITGVLLNGGWSNIEQKDGEFDFTRLDRAIEILKKNGKKCGLGIHGSHPPAFVYEAGAQKFIYRDDNPHHGERYLTEQEMPLPWDPIWQKYYERVLRKTGEHLKGNPTVESIVLSCSRTAEMHFPRRPEEVAKWKSYPNYDQKVIDAYKKFMDVLGEAFPQKQIVLMVSQMFNENDLQNMSDTEIITKIVDYGVQKYPDRLTLQNNQLDGRRDDKGKMSYDILMRYKDKLHNGFQSLASFKTPDRQGSFEMAVFNYIQCEPEYWELWRGDGSDPELCKKLTAMIEEARALGVEAYKKKLVDAGMFKKPEDDTYPKKVQEMRDQAIKEFEQKKKAAAGKAE